MNARILQPIKSEDPFYKVVFFFVILFVLITLSNYDVCWMHFEIYQRQMPFALSNGTGIVFEDLSRAFDINNIDGVNRVRFVSYLFQIIDAKFRVWLFNYIPPHPSLSLTWIFSLILTPVFLFKFVYNLTFSRTNSWSCLLLYLVSPGWLSGITFFSLSGKPLSSFLTIFCLYLASEINLSVSTGGFPKKDLRLYYILLFTLLLGFFTDEVAWFVYLAIPVIFYNIFTTSKRRILVILSYVAIPVSFLTFVVYLAPLVITHPVGGGFAYYGYAAAGGWSPTIKHMTHFSFYDAILTGHYLISSHIVPFQRPDFHNFFRIDIYVYTLSLLYFYYLFTRLPYRYSETFLRTFATLLLFISFHTLLMSFHLPAYPHSPHYYGAIFSIFYVLPLSILLTTIMASSKMLPTLNKIILIFLLVTSASNFYNISLRKKAQESFLHSGDTITPNTKRLVMEAWNNRYNRDVISKLRKENPQPDVGWLFVELEYLNKTPD